jgi:hypothetical protein
MHPKAQMFLRFCFVLFTIGRLDWLITKNILNPNWVTSSLTHKIFFLQNIGDQRNVERRGVLMSLV